MKSRGRPAGSSRRASSLSRPRARSAGAWPGRWTRWTASPEGRAILLAAATAIGLHLPSLGYDFVRDDRQLVLENPSMRGPGGFGRLMGSDFWASAGGVSGLWRPLVLLTFWIEGRLGDWSPVVFHASNLLVHGMVAALLVRLALRSGAGALAAGAAGLWFAAMPAHVESVAWIAGRTDLWSAMFALLALGLDRRGILAGSLAPRVLAAGAFAQALLAKESAAPVALAMLVQAWVLRPKAPAGARRVLHLVPLVAAIALWAALHRWAAGPVPESAALARSGADFLRLALATPAALLAQLWPGAVHGPDLALTPGRATPALAAAGALLLAGGAAAVATLARRRHAAAVPAALLWAPLAALAALVAAARTAQFGERHLYIPSLGAAWLLASLVERRGPGTWGTARAVGAGVLVAWSALATSSALPAWRNDAAMYAAMERTQPGYATAPLGRALLALDAGRDDEALTHLARAQALDSTRFEIPLYWGRIALGRGRFEEADSLARRAQALGGWNRDAALMQALALQRLGRWDGARPVLEALRARDAEDLDAAWAWAAQLAGEGRHGEAAASYQSLLAASPADYEGWLALAASRAALDDRVAAGHALDRAAVLPEAADGRASAARGALARAPFRPRELAPPPSR